MVRRYSPAILPEGPEGRPIIKKKGDSAIMREASVREAFVEEMSDVLMYYFDTLLRYGVTPEEISNAYVAKHNKNMGRDYQREYNNKYTK